MSRPDKTLPVVHPAIERFGMILGFGAVGASTFALLAAGPRVLGQDGYTTMALIWTAVTIINFGIAMPGEQVITRSVAAGAGTGTVRPVARRMFVATPVIVVLLILSTDSTSSGGSFAVWLAALLIAAVSSALLAVGRGELAGRGAFGAYSLLLFAETAIRLTLIAAAVLVPAQGPLLLAAAIALPFVVCAAVSRVWVKRLGIRGDLEVAEDTRLEQLSTTAVSVFMQICLSTAQFWLHRQAVDPALSGAFVTAISYMRIPTVLAGGIYAPLLNAAAEAFAEGDSERVRRKTLEALAIGSGGSAVVCALLLALSGIGMAILYGPDNGLPLAAFGWLGASTVAAIAASVLTNALYGCSRAPIAAVAWVLPTLITTALYALAAGNPTALAIAATVGQVLATLILLVVFMTRALPSGRVVARS